MDVQRIARLAQLERQCIGLVCDPTAESGERWIATVGLDAIAAGATPHEALHAALVREAFGPEPMLGSH